MDDAGRDGLLTLTLTPGLGPTLTRRCLQVMGSAEAVLGASAAVLGQVQGIGLKRAGEIRREMDRLLGEGACEGEKQRMAELGARALVVEDAEYPALLKKIPDPPPVLYCRGRLRPEDALAVAIVGTRRCSAYGREQADRFASLCAQAGLCIVSGGALGVDTAAHRAALRVGGRTIAVLGSGLTNPYPPANKELFESIVACGERGGESLGEGGLSSGGGAVVSELPMMTPPIAENFPSRNRIISGMSLGVLVIEAPKRSGALITARLAAEDHGREVMAVPGRVDTPNSAGVHQAIREGWATLVTNAGEVLDALGESGQILKASLEKRGTGPADDGPSLLESDSLSDTQKKILAALSGPMTLDQLVAATGLPVAGIQGDVTVLEIRGLIARGDGVYRRRGGALGLMMG